ncbi:MAG TPA: tetraacyldisaccharide 4'-kinase, partial [Bacteroidales bacterium]|nr:tetraacyldisaccharide 4'-kinase [Bacteroidales bacterium]
MKLWRLIFLPLSLIYGIIVYIRNKLYEYKILHFTSFNIPIISVGNLCTGGSGKTPHVEYLIKLLSDKYNVAVLSRGYKRNTNNFIVANTSTQWQQIGDEPMQYFKKFNNIIVAVDRKRKNGIYNLIKLYKNLSVILLDDAYQHRQVKPGLSILLTDYYHPYYNDYLLPTGNLREPPSEAK